MREPAWAVFGVSLCHTLEADTWASEVCHCIFLVRIEMATRNRAPRAKKVPDKLRDNFSPAVTKTDDSGCCVCGRLDYLLVLYRYGSITCPGSNVHNVYRMTPDLLGTCIHLSPQLR